MKCLLEIKAGQVIANRTEDRDLSSPHPFGAQTFLSCGIRRSHYTCDIHALESFVEGFGKYLPKLQFSQWMNPNKPVF